jgi:hypothetical protein
MVVTGQKGTKSKCQVLTDEKLDEISARLEHSSQKSLRCLAQEIGVALEKHQISSLRNSN